MTHICVSKLSHHWFRYWLVAWPVPSHYLNQYWNIVNLALRNKLQWKVNRNSKQFHSRKCIWKGCLCNGSHFVSASMGKDQQLMSCSQIPCNNIRGCCEIWEALVLRTSDMASTLVRNRMSTCPKWIKLICAIIICSSIGRVSSDSHLSYKAKIVFQTLRHPFQRPLHMTWKQKLVFPQKYITLKNNLTFPSLVIHLHIWLFLGFTSWLSRNSNNQVHWRHQELRLSFLQ